MMQYSLRCAVGTLLSVLAVASGGSWPVPAYSQALPHLRTTFVARNTLQPSPCHRVGCFTSSSYDANTLAATGSLVAAVYVFLRISAGPWYEQAVLQNRSTLPDGYSDAGYRAPIAVVGDDILVTAYQTGPAVPETCVTNVLGRTGTRWQVKQVINVCADMFAKDGNRILFGMDGPMPIYSRGSNGLFTEESRVLPPSSGFFDGEKSLALHAWTVVVGRPGVNASTGAAYIFQRRGGQWLLMETLTPEGAGANTRFGDAVGVYEYNVAVSAPGAISPAGVGSGLVYMYTGVNDSWFVSQEIAETMDTGNTFGTALAMRGRRLVVSAENPFLDSVRGYLFERGVRESSWIARATLGVNGATIDLSGNTAMMDNELRLPQIGSNPTVVNLPTLREPDLAP